MTVSKKKTPKKQRKRQRLGVEGQRVRIQKAAMDVLAEMGIEQASVEDVIVYAGVSRQTFYRCYPNKDALVHDIQENLTRDLMQALQGNKAATRQTSLDEELRRLFTFARNIGPIAAELDREALRPGSPYYLHRRTRIEFGAMYAEHWIRLRLGNKPLPSRDLFYALSLAMSQIFLEFVRATDPKVQKDLERACRALVTAILNSIGLKDASLPPASKKQRVSPRKSAASRRKKKIKPTGRSRR